MLVHALGNNECLSVSNTTIYFQIVNDQIVVGIEGKERCEFKQSQHKINFKKFIKNLAEKEVKST